MNDDELDELILGRLRRRRGQASETAGRTRTPADLAVFFSEPEERVRDRLNALAAEGRVKESTVIPDGWMIALGDDVPDA